MPSGCCDSTLCVPYVQCTRDSNLACVGAEHSQNTIRNIIGLWAGVMEGIQVRYVCDVCVCVALIGDFNLVNRMSPPPT